MRTGAELLVAAVAIIGVVIALYQANEIKSQLRQQVAIQQGASDQQLLGAIREIDTMFVSSPDLRPFFYWGHKVPPRGYLKTRVFATAERLLDTVDAVASARRHHLLTSQDWKAWQEAFHAYYRTSPALQRMWKKTAYIYFPETRQLLCDGTGRRCDVGPAVRPDGR